VSPERKRCTIDEVRRRLGPDKISERRACKVLGQPRGTQRYSKRRAADEAKLLARIFHPFIDRAVLREGPSPGRSGGNCKSSLHQD